MMSDPKVDQFKVWLTQLDRVQFSDVLLSGSREEVIKRHPLTKKPYTRNYDPRPRMVAAYLYFIDRIRVFFLGEEGDVPVASEHPLPTRVGECFQTLKNGLMIVVIDLQKDDDP
ncbi:hypothetical protein HDF14_004082 [Edaphobacter lichenicola]|uniref:Uncharacterized protein n=1 Tax=Tunturiibacter gelidiferens TaxID=3069689 RepID=A0A9X0QH72_9BACT|nr:hypothetical protein [Edaphobacter lichenicola]